MATWQNLKNLYGFYMKSISIGKELLKDMRSLCKGKGRDLGTIVIVIEDADLTPWCYREGDYLLVMCRQG